MKKVILSIAIIGTVLSTQAQNKEDKKVNFGVKAGVNLASLNVSGTEGDDNFDTRIGYHFGGFAEINVAESFAIQPEVLFSLQGAKIKGFDGSSDDVTVHFNLSYINVPVLFKYKMSGFGAYIGPQVGFNVAAKAKAKLDGDSQSEDLKDSFEKIDFAGVIGAEYTLPVGLGISARYQLGLSNIAKDSEGDGKVKSNVLAVGVYYRF